MYLFETLLLILSLILGRIIWRNRRFLYLSYKVPLSTFDISPSSIWEFICGDGKVIFDKIDVGLEGTTLTKTFIGHMVMMNVLSPEDVKIILNSKYCVDKPFFMKEFQHLTQGTLFGHIEPWQSHRKILNPYFGLQALRSIIPILNEKVKILMQNVKEMDGKGEFNVFHHMSALTLETFLSVMEYDKDIQNQKGESRDVFIKNLENYAEAITLRIFKFWLHPDAIYKYSDAYKMERNAHENCAMTFSPSIIQNTRNKMAETNNNNEVLEGDGKQKTFIRALVDPKNNLSDREIQDEIGTLILAAQDTSAIASSASLLLLAMSKDKQDKVVEELRHVFGTSTDNLYIDIEQINELHYMEMVINEAMRLIPVVPIVARSNDQEITLSEGYVMPVDSNLIIPVFKIHRNKEFWGKDANEFRPERFEKEEFKKVHPYAYIPFAKGPRMCVGWRYAMFLMKIQLANFLLRYEVDTSLKLHELQFKFNITLTVMQGFMISIKERRK